MKSYISRFHADDIINSSNLNILFKIYIIFILKNNISKLLKRILEALH